MADKNITRQLSIYINDREVVNSLGGITREMSKVRGQLRNLNKGSDDYDQKSKELKNTLSQLKDQQSQFKDELYETNITASEAGETFSNLFVGLTTGNMKLVKEGLTGIKGSIVAATRAGLAFIATPIGAAIAVLTAAFASAKAIFDYNAGLHELNEELRALGVESENISKVRSEIEATAETFDKDFNELAKRADSLAESYGISISEANQLIAQGLADGGAKNAEFLDSLGEYDNFFASAGYSAKEFIDVINTGYDLGIYTDKLPDALKEADLALKENTKTTRDALVNAFGASFSDDILNKVKTGEATTRQALEAIAAEAAKTGLSQQQQAQLTADIFKGAGEDAGGALKIFEAIGQSATRELDKTAEAQLELVEANERLNKAQAELFEVEGFGDIWTSIKVVAVDALAGILEFFADIKTELQPLIDLVGPIFSAAWGELKKAFSATFSVIKQGFGLLPKLLETTVNGIYSVYNTIIEFLQRIVNASSLFLETIGVDVDALNHKLEGLKRAKIEFDKTDRQTNETVNTTTNQTNNTGGGGATADELKAQQAARDKAAEQQKKADEKAKREELDRALALVKAKETLAKSELDNFVALQRSKIDTDKALTQALVNEEVNRLQRVLDKQIEFNAQQLERDLAEAERAAQSEAELVALKEAINLDYQTNKQELELAFQESTDQLKTEYEEQQKILKAEQLLLEQELAEETAANDWERQRLQEQTRYNEQLYRYKTLLDDKKITTEQYNAFVEAATKKTNEIQMQQELQKAQAVLGALDSVANALTAAFGQSKEMAIVQANISGAQSVLSIWSAPAVLPQPFDSILKGVLSAAVAINTITQVRKIKSQKAPKTPKFYYGGHTGNRPALGSDEYGPVTGYVHKNEYVIPEVMTQDPAYADTIGWLEAKRQQKLKGYVNGGPTGENITNPAAGNATVSNTSAALAASLNQLNSILNNGIIAKAIIGYEDADAIKTLQEETDISNENGALNDTST